MRTITALIVLFHFILLSCSNKKSVETLSEIKYDRINVTPNSQLLSFSEIFDSCEIIQIDSPIIGEVRKIIRQDNKLIIYAISEDFRFHIYDLKDKTTESIVEIGKGPDQFLTVRDFSVKDSILYVVDYSNRRIGRFMLSGELLDFIQVPGSYESCAKLSDDTYVLLDYSASDPSEVNYKLKYYSLGENRITKSFIPLQSILTDRLFNETTTLYYLDDSIRLFQVFSDTIYNISQNNVSPRFILDYENLKVPDDIYYNKNYSLMDFVNYCRENKRIWNLNQFFEGTDFLFFLYSYDDEYYFNFYNKPEHSNLSGYGLNDDIFTLIKGKISDIGTGFFPVGVSKNELYFVLEPYELLERKNEILINLESIKNFSNKEKLIALLESISIEDNPLIIKFKYNEN